MADDFNILNQRFNQQAQIIDQYRVSMYNSDLRMELLMKILVEKGIMVKDEFDKRWPLFLKNDIGAMNQEGFMEGSLKVHMYGMK